MSTAETLFPASPEQPLPEQTTAEGPWGGPTYSYRGARIECLKGGHVCGLVMDGHPLTGNTFGVVGTITPLVDLWLDEGRLPRSSLSSHIYSFSLVTVYLPNDTTCRPGRLRKGRESMSEDRRNFINRAGKVAIATPPALALLLKAEGRHYALALSGGPTGGVSFGQGGIVAGGGGSTVHINGNGVTVSNGSSTVNAGLGGVTVKR